MKIWFILVLLEVVGTIIHWAFKHWTLYAAQTQAPQSTIETCMKIPWRVCCKDTVKSAFECAHMRLSSSVCGTNWHWRHVRLRCMGVKSLLTLFPRFLRFLNICLERAVTCRQILRCWSVCGVILRWFLMGFHCQSAENSLEIDIGSNQNDFTLPDCQKIKITPQNFL